MKLHPLIATSTLLALCACGTVPASQPESVQVQIDATYRERIALTPGHVLTVKVEDVSLADAPSVTLAQSSVPLDGRSPPYRVALTIPTNRIDPANRYAARAEIRDSEGKLRFTTDTHHGVLTRGQPAAATIIMIGGSLIL